MVVLLGLKLKVLEGFYGSSCRVRSLILGFLRGLGP